MQFLRSLIFFVLLQFMTLLLGVTSFFVLLIPSANPAFKIAIFWSRSVIWLAKIVVGIDYRVEGQKPEGQYIFASKHQSAWETFALFFLLDCPIIILKRELLFIPVFGWFLWKVSPIAIDRSKGLQAIKSIKNQAIRKKSEGRSYLIFPQGTRVEPGKEKKYLPGVTALYSALDLPVVPIALNTGMFWKKGQFVKVPGTVVVKFLKPLPVKLKKQDFVKELEKRIESESDKLM